ncbi:uncharacterized protein [Montipora capricornis]|uniref:uncharacterized protein n=1 Tax=Montipora capricornis TaxID=246305 RepID=UPI0035F18226
MTEVLTCAGVVRLEFFVQIRSEATWSKINYGRSVCFETRNGRPGYVVYRGAQGILLGAMKLKYTGGHVRCVSQVAYNSRWGCHDQSTFKNYPLNVVIADKHNNVIFPLKRFIKHSAGMWYNMSMVDEKHTDELVFSNFEYPLYVERHMELRIWYGEDLKNWFEKDNQGRVCVDVYGYIIEPMGSIGEGAQSGGTSRAQALIRNLKDSLKESHAEQTEVKTTRSCDDSKSSKTQISKTKRKK